MSGCTVVCAKDLSTGAPSTSAGGGASGGDLRGGASPARERRTPAPLDCRRPRVGGPLRHEASSPRRRAGVAGTLGPARNLTLRGRATLWQVASSRQSERRRGGRSRLLLGRGAGDPRRMAPAAAARLDALRRPALSDKAGGQDVPLRIHQPRPQLAGGGLPVGFDQLAKVLPGAGEAGKMRSVMARATSSRSSASSPLIELASPLPERGHVAG